MSTLVLRPRSRAEIQNARIGYDAVGHGASFFAELEAVLDVIQAMPLRFPVIHGAIHRALLRRYPFAVFFRIRPATTQVVVLAVLPQRCNPARWPRR